MKKKPLKDKLVEQWTLGGWFGFLLDNRKCYDNTKTYTEES